MHLPPLTQGTLIRRYKRFLADVDFGGQCETVHCPNPGAMTGLKQAGQKVWCWQSPNPKRKLGKTLELVESDGGLVGINTMRPNAIAEEAGATKRIPALADYSVCQREYTWKKAVKDKKQAKKQAKKQEGVRFDMLLDESHAGDPPMVVEVKNVHLMRQAGLAEFPDATTARGSKHLLALMEAKKSGLRAGLLFVIQRMDCRRFTLASDIDPLYTQYFVEAVAAGVEIMAWQCHISLESIKLDCETKLVMPRRNKTI